METPTIRACPFIENPDPQYIQSDIEENPEKFVKELLGGSRFGFGVDNVMKSGVYRHMGYAYDLNAVLRRFVYKQYGAWQEARALNKTNLRRLVHGRIDEIIEA